MQVVAHPDPFVLEAELLRRITAAQAANALAPVLVVVPTRRLADHVRRRLAQHAGAALAVEVLHHRALTFHLVERGGGIPQRPASERLLLALLDEVLAGKPENPWSRYTQRRPGARRALLATLTDLRESGITPARAAAVLESGHGAEALPEIYAGYVERLEAAASTGLHDEAGLVAAVLATARQQAGRYAAILHHGAYELIGIHLDLVRP